MAARNTSRVWPGDGRTRLLLSERFLEEGGGEGGLHTAGISGANGACHVRSVEPWGSTERHGLVPVMRPITLSSSPAAQITRFLWTDLGGMRRVDFPVRSPYSRSHNSLSFDLRRRGGRARLNAHDSKSCLPLRVTGVQIPPPPPSRPRRLRRVSGWLPCSVLRSRPAGTQLDFRAPPVRARAQRST